MGPKVLPKHTFATKQERIEYLINIVKKPLVPQTTDIDRPPTLPNQHSQKANTVVSTQALDHCNTVNYLLERTRRQDSHYVGIGAERDWFGQTLVAAR